MLKSLQKNPNDIRLSWFILYYYSHSILQKKCLTKYAELAQKLTDA